MKSDTCFLTVSVALYLCVCLTVYRLQFLFLTYFMFFHYKLDIFSNYPPGLILVVGWLVVSFASWLLQRDQFPCYFQLFVSFIVGRNLENTHSHAEMAVVYQGSFLPSLSLISVNTCVLFGIVLHVLSSSNFQFITLQFLPMFWYTNC